MRLMALALLRARRERPTSSRAADERDELAARQLIELHFGALPPGLQDIELARISQRACWHLATSLGSADVGRRALRYTPGTMNAQIEW
jgi:hypothetical protein